MVREWKVEWMKTRYRGIGWIVLAFFRTDCALELLGIA